MKPTFSVIMASYNHEKYLEEVIRSILNQTYENFELIIIDDCSKDNSPKIIEECGKKDSRIRTFFHRKNMGIARTYNEGLKYARGDFIVISSSDDPSERQRLEIVKKIINDRLDVDFISSDAYILREEDVATNLDFAYPVELKPRQSSIRQRIIKHNCIIAPSVVFRSKSRGDILFDERLKYLNDWLFWIELLQIGNFYFVDRPLIKYRRHDANTDVDWYGYSLDYIIMERILREKNLLSKEGRVIWQQLVLKRTLLLIGEYIKRKDFIALFKMVGMATEKIITRPSLIGDVVVPYYKPKIKKRLGLGEC